MLVDVLYLALLFFSFFLDRLLETFDDICYLGPYVLYDSGQIEPFVFVLHKTNSSSLRSFNNQPK
jgi:hypothetical protein